MAEATMSAPAASADGRAVDGSAAAAAPTPPQQPPATAASFSLRRNIQQLPPISATLCVALGGALGALLRYGFIQACAPYQASSTTVTTSAGLTVVTLHKPFPLSTFVSNMLGCLLIGLLSVLLPALLAQSPRALLLVRSLLVTGWLGALTTMSSFALDTAQLWERQASRRQGEPGVLVVQAGDGREWVGVVYWLVTNAGGIGLVGVGRRAGRWIERRPVRAAANQKTDAEGAAVMEEQASGAHPMGVRGAAVAERKVEAGVEASKHRCARVQLPV